MKYTTVGYSDFGEVRFEDGRIILKAERDGEEAFFGLKFFFDEWEQDAYVFMPACAYNGNRFKRVMRGYPPMYRPDEVGADAEPLINDVPALNKDGSGEIEVTTGDMATPCVGIFYREAKQGILIYTEQAVKGRNLGFSLKAGELMISCPAKRKEMYRFGVSNAKGDDQGIAVIKGEQVEVGIAVVEFACGSMAEFYKKFFDTRKSLLHNDREPNMYTDELWNVMERHFNTANWSGQYYAEASKIWQCGWVGGGMSSYPLMKHGKEQSVQRAAATVDFMTEHQAKSGFFYGFIKNGIIMDDSFGYEGMEKIHLVRKSADGLYFLFKHFTLGTPKQQWVQSAKRCADAFVKLFESYGTFGQFVDVESGELIVGSSSAGAMAIGALARAGRYFGSECYMKIAKQAGEMYYRRFISNGISMGAIGEALCAPDSESIFAFVESYVALYEETKEEKWLSYAQDCAHMASSWVVTYSYMFPEGSEFERLKINTVGSVFANVQNKHSAPGITSLSGDAVYKLWLYTGDERYLELIRDIASFMPQCVSRKERPIHAREPGNPAMPEGYINERVNMSDWEGKECIGTVFYGTCWCETSLILTFSELIWEYGLSW